jgi:exodeoxyribonuclease VII small subunit
MKKINLEKKLLELEELVKELEKGDLDLNDAITKYTEAMIIAKECNEYLANAEEQINKILVDGKLEDFIPKN